MRREKSKRSLQKFNLFKDVRHLIEFKEFLLCALALKSIQLHIIIEKDAINFLYKLKR